MAGAPSGDWNESVVWQEEDYDPPPPYLHMIEAYLDGNRSGQHDFRRPYVRESLRYVWPLFVFLHAGIMLFGTCGNLGILVVLLRRGLFRNPTYFFLGNLALSDLINAAVVLPITIANLIIQNWLFGSFLCYFLPMLHSFPTHASILTYTVLAADRYRFIIYPMKSRFPAGLCVLAVWVVAVCIVLPFAVYITFIDLGARLGPEFKGVGICIVSGERPIEEYIRAMFVTLYCLPLAVIAFLYVKVSAELKNCEMPVVTMHIDDAAHSVSEMTYQSHVTWSTNEPDHKRDPADTSAAGYNQSRNATRPHQSSIRSYEDPRPSQSEDDDDIDLHKEKRTQKYLISMVTLFAMTWCPIKILSLVTHFVHEDDDNAGHFDITYLTFTFIGYLSTCVNPVLFASWRMSDQTKDRLRGYFRFSNRRTPSAHALTSRPEVFSDNEPQTAPANSRGCYV